MDTKCMNCKKENASIVVMKYKGRLCNKCFNEVYVPAMLEADRLSRSQKAKKSGNMLDTFKFFIGAIWYVLIRKDKGVCKENG